VENITDKIFIAVAGADFIVKYNDYGLTFDSSEVEFLEALRPAIQERYNVDIKDTSGWLYKTRKASESRNVYLIPNSTAGGENRLSYLDNEARLAAYKSLTEGCQHVWSKGKVQKEKLEKLLDVFSILAEKDPLFLAHFTSYAITKSDSKDLKVLTTYANSLSDADGLPFSKDSEFKKPNWRLVSAAALTHLDPKLVDRVLELATSKVKFGSKPEATHYSKPLKTAAKKYLKYRETNIKSVEGVKKAGLNKTYQNLYRLARVAPSVDVVKILGWKQKPGYPGAGVEKNKSVFDFTGMDDLQIAEKIRSEKLSPLAVMGALPDKISPVVAASILEQTTGDQAVILTEMFESQGLLKNKEVKKVYTEKIKTAKNALDRVDRIQAKMDEDIENILKESKSDSRKDTVGNIGKVFLHIDISGSMHQALEIACDKGGIIAECVKDPTTNFHWGVFNHMGKELPLPQKFTKDGFKAALYSITTGGSTNCLALYPRARQLGCDTDFYITDQEHTDGQIRTMVDSFRCKGLPDPKQVVIIAIGRSTTLKDEFEALGIPVSVLKPEQLSESALVAQAIKIAIKGATALIDEVMNTKLLSLPKWYEAVRV
jgi:hypothetical protein